MTGVILIDGGYFRASWKERNAPTSTNGRRLPYVPSADVLRNAIERLKDEVTPQIGVAADGLRWLRTYYYDTDPFEGALVQPNGQRVDFGSNAAASHQKQLLEELRLSRQVAVRKGQLRFRAWESHAHGFRPIFQQKGVDMKIGLDVAWIATKKIADIIVLVTADTDFIAPMKLARKEGVTVCLCSLDRGTVSSDLREHADICLTIATES